VVGRIELETVAKEAEQSCGDMRVLPARLPHVSYTPGEAKFESMSVR